MQVLKGDTWFASTLTGKSPDGGFELCLRHNGATEFVPATEASRVKQLGPGDPEDDLKADLKRQCGDDGLNLTAKVHKVDPGPGDAFAALLRTCEGELSAAATLSGIASRLVPGESRHADVEDEEGEEGEEEGRSDRPLEGGRGRRTGRPRRSSSKRLTQASVQAAALPRAHNRWKSGNASTSEGPGSGQVAAFVHKLYEIFHDPTLADLCYWDDAGKYIIIRDRAECEERVLPVWFKHSRFRSLARQLNSYNFLKVVGSQHTTSFQHPLFMRGRFDLIGLISRKESVPRQNEKGGADDDDAPEPKSYGAPLNWEPRQLVKLAAKPVKLDPITIVKKAAGHEREQEPQPVFSVEPDSGAKCSSSCDTEIELAIAAGEAASEAPGEARSAASFAPVVAELQRLRAEKEALVAELSKLQLVIKAGQEAQVAGAEASAALQRDLSFAQQELSRANHQREHAVMREKFITEQYEQVGAALFLSDVSGASRAQKSLKSLANRCLCVPVAAHERHEHERIDARARGLPGDPASALPPVVSAAAVPLALPPGQEPAAAAAASASRASHRPRPLSAASLRASRL